jgi:hypothetical protein
MKSKKFMFLLFAIGSFIDVLASPYSPDGLKKCKDWGDTWPCRRSGYGRV